MQTFSSSSFTAKTIKQPRKNSKDMSEVSEHFSMSGPAGKPEIEHTLSIGRGRPERKKNYFVIVATSLFIVIVIIVIIIIILICT